MEKCVECENGRYHKASVKNYKYHTPMGIITIQGNSEVLKCDKCKSLLIPGKTYDKWHHLILQGLAEKKGPLDSKELQFILSVLPYNQNEIAVAMGKEKSTLTHYKNGKNPIDRLFDFELRKIITDFLHGNQKTLDLLSATFKFEGEPMRKVRVN